MATVHDPIFRIPHLSHVTERVNVPKIKQLDRLYSTAKPGEMGENFYVGVGTLFDLRPRWQHA